MFGLFVRTRSYSSSIVSMKEASLCQKAGLSPCVLRRSAGTAAGVLEDYGCVAEGFLALLQATGDPSWLRQAGVVLDTALDLFGTDVSLMRERLQSPLSEAFPEYKLRRTWC
jgi:uncharacterized protein YyaL (SSP411 family)